MPLPALPGDGSDQAESRHAAVAAWFFGPRAENFSHIQDFVKHILDEQKKTRENLFPTDTAQITTEMQNSKLFQGQIEHTKTRLNCLLKMLNDHSVPFWSPRYNAHMSMETSMPSVVGYLAGLFHNQNNVATEASPISTILEIKVGIDLCRMFGYDLTDTNPGHAWGHITSGGSVANLESIWSARNLKFYPLSLFLTISRGPLGFLQDRVGQVESFNIKLCTGVTKPFMKCSTWELLNLEPATVLNIPEVLYQTYGISQSTLATSMHKYLIQTMGKDALEREFKIIKPTQILVGTTKHYSWPKGAAIAGIGSANVVDVPVDRKARMDMEKLRGMLQKSLDNGQAIYSVIAIIGSTEHGAVDPLADILKLREEFEKKGLSFVVHCDGAWGGYFASMLPKEKARFIPEDVPTLPLSPYTARHLRAFAHADSITVDPHKSGYCPYPAGGLCYRDGRMRYLVTWTSPVVFRANENKVQESIGVYGVEGSKPGAAAVGTYLSHRVLGLNPEGYGTLLGEAVFSCTRLYCHWAAMDPQELSVPLDDHGTVTTKAKLIVRPLIMLPKEEAGCSKKEIEEEKNFIRKYILPVENSELSEEAMGLLKLLGGDLMINAFACNFEVEGRVNTDVIEANYLNSKIFTELSISDSKKDIPNVKLILTSTSLAQSQYGDCLTHFKDRLGLKGDQDLYVLINVTMSPWPTYKNLVNDLAKAFKDVAQKHMKAAVRRNIEYPHHHGFVVQGVDQICGVHLPMFNMENHRTQLVISCDFPPEVIEKYRKRKAAKPNQFFTFGNKKRANLLDLIKDGASFEATLQEELPSEKQDPIADGFTVSNVKILLQRSMHHKDLQDKYPQKMVFFAYGRGSELHMDHLLNVSPNRQLNSERIKILDSKTSSSLEDQIAKNGVWLRLRDVNESALQPLIMPEDQDPFTMFNHPGLKFVPGAEFGFEAFASESDALNIGSTPIDIGRLQLGPSVFSDFSMVNADGGASKHAGPSPSATAACDAQTDVTALATEYPNPGACLELQNLYQTSVIRGFRDRWASVKQDEANRILEEVGVGTGFTPNSPEMPNLPKWLEDFVVEAKEATLAKKKVVPIRMYHSGLH